MSKKENVAMKRIAEACTSLLEKYVTVLTVQEKRKEAHFADLLKRKAKGENPHKEGNRTLKNMQVYADLHHGQPLYERNARGEVVKFKYELVSTHTARRSGVTNLYKSRLLDKRDMMAINGHQTEQIFEEYIKVSKSEHADRIAAKLRQGITIRGRRVINTMKFNLDDMLIGNKEKIKEQIRKFRKTYKCTTHLSFLLIMLVRAECVDKFISYPHFHHAMEELEGKKYDMDRVSRMYNYMFYHKDEFEKSELPKWCNGRMIIRNWQKSFERCQS